MARDIGPAYDLIYGWDGLSPSDHEQICQGLLVPMLKNIARNTAGKSNWQTWHNAAFLWGGGLLGDVSWIRRAISDLENGFIFQMDHSVTEDGMWYENSWGYHFYTLSAMIEIAETARRLNIDLWSHPALKKMFTVALDYTMPDGHFPRFGDDTNTSISRVANDFEFAYQAYRDPEMLPYLPTRPTRNSIMFGRTPTPAPRSATIVEPVVSGCRPCDLANFRSCPTRGGDDVRPLRRLSRTPGQAELCVLRTGRRTGLRSWTGAQPGLPPANSPQLVQGDARSQLRTGRS